MLVDPSIDDLLLKINNKFKLVTLATKRARQINEGDPDMKSYNSAKPISKALQEIYAGEVYDRSPADKIKAENKNTDSDEDGIVGLIKSDSEISSLLENGI